MSAMRRFTVLVDTELYERMEQIKKDSYYDRPHTEMFRALLTKGVDEVEKQARKNH